MSDVRCQSEEASGIRRTKDLSSVIRHLTSGFCPTWTAAAVTRIDPAFFTERGIRAVILDLDNTLVPWRSDVVSEEIGGWVRRMRDAGLSLCLLSNTHRPGRLSRLSQTLGIEYVPRSSKPRRAGFLRAMAMLNASPGETAVIGDQVMTDIWGGNRCGLMTVLVDRLSDREFVGTRWINRNIESLLLARLRRMGLLRDIPGGVES
jgi:HAD superfamily phosphatase (TIGR01668 family)